MKTHLLPLLTLLALTTSTKAQQLLWERAILHPNASGSEAAENVQPYGPNRLLLTGPFAPPRAATGCRPPYQAYYQLYDLNGTLLREQLGRKMGNGESDFQLSASSGGWWTAPGAACISTTSYSRAYVHRISAHGDTLLGWPLVTTSPPRTSALALIERRNKLYVAGVTINPGQANQVQQVNLTCTDTLGTVLWQRTYPRQPMANDYVSGMTSTPRGGFLIGGDAQRGTTDPGFFHQILETDSMGRFRRNRLLQPFGLTNGIRYSNGCNLLTLPNAGGYLLSGTADSVVGGSTVKHAGYTMRLDTSLQQQWIYRHPPQLGGTNAGGNYAYRLRVLPNNTVGLLVNDVRPTGTPVTFLVQLDVVTGRRQALYTLVSNTESSVIPYDWQWLGDGTLLVAGKSVNSRTNFVNSYVARWDFRGTPLATGLGARPGQHGRLVAYPNPATEQVSFAFAGLSQEPTRLQVLELSTGRLVGEQAVSSSDELRVSVEQLPSGVYAARLLSKDAQVLGTTKLVVVH